MKGQLAHYLTNYSTNPNADIALQQTDKHVALCIRESDVSCLAPIPPLSSYATIVANLNAQHDGISAKVYLEKLIFADQWRRLQDEEEMS